MRKPEAAHLLNWFYAIPPCRWFLPFGGSRTLQIIRVRNANMHLPGMDVKAAILGPKVQTRHPLPPYSYFKILNMLEKSSVQMRKGRFWRSTVASFSNSGWAAAVARSMISVQEHEKHMVSSSFGFQW